MTKFKIILAILAVLILVTSFTFFLSSRSGNKPVSHAAVKVVLGQTPDYTLSLKTLSVENSYSSDYKLAVPYGYYNVKIIGDGDSEFFSGTVARNKVAFPPDEIELQNGETSSVNVTLEPLSEIALYLPYYTRAKKIVFYDEKNLEKLQVDLGETSLPEDYTRRLCGNGICDFNENILFCFKDCRPR